ncbi:MAG: 50S ribosomal protein L11 methyltransferase, partial [Pseudomonadota bacterium]
WRPRRVADIGAGTGVLAMGAAKLWRVPAVAADIDAVATATARANVAVNCVADCVRTLTGPGFRHPEIRRTAPYDLVLANILAAPLKRLAPDMRRHLAPGGRAILSGLLNVQAPGVLAVYRSHGFVPCDRVVIGEWTSLLLKRA